MTTTLAAMLVAVVGGGRCPDHPRRAGRDATACGRDGPPVRGALDRSADGVGPPVGDTAGTGTANPAGPILVGFASPKRRKEEFLPGLVMSMR